MKNQIGRGLIASIVAAAAMSSAQAQETAADYPSETVHLVVPFSAGGATDVMARFVADALTEAWGQPVIVDNRPGATGAIAAEYVMEAEPDGYTLLVGTASVNTVAPSVSDDLPFDTLTDFAPITTLSVFPNILVVNPQVPAETVGEFIELLQTDPERYTFASSGIGSSIHLTGELFQQLTGTEMLHVPYPGSAPARTDLIAGNVDAMFDNLSSVLPLIEEGRLRGLAVTGDEPDPAAPDLPTVAETVEGFSATSWIGLLAPAGTPEDIVAKIAEAAEAAISDPEVSQAMLDLGLTPASRSPAEFAEFLADDMQRWADVVAGAGISVN